MGLKFDPMGGGQLKEALNKIIEIERQPIQKLEQRKAIEQAKYDLFKQFKTKFSDFTAALNEISDPKKFKELKADAGDGANLVEVKLDKNTAKTGTYNLSVEQIAKHTSVITNGFSSPDEPVIGMGFIVMQKLNGDDGEVFIDEGESSLRTMANIINSEKDCAVKATLIQDYADYEKPWKLLITAKEEGFDQQIDFPHFYFLDGDEDFWVDDDHEADNAALTIDGFDIEAKTNNIADFLEGVHLRIRDADPDKVFTLSITEDKEKITEKVKKVVDQVNGVLEFINKQNAIDESTDTRSTFAGDTGLQIIEYRLRNVLHEGYPIGDPDSKDFKWVWGNQLGIQFQRSGLLGFDAEKFKTAMEKDYDLIEEAIAGPYGFAAQMNKVIQGYTRSYDGLITMRDKVMQERIKQFDTQIANKERQIEKKTEALTGRFSRLQGALNTLKGQQQYLNASLGSQGGGSSVSQLLG